MTKRWRDLQKSLREVSSSTVFQKDVHGYLNGPGWGTRLHRQLTPLHWTAYYLHPDTLDETLGCVRDEVMRCLRKYGTSEAVQEFDMFRTKDEGFFNAACWEERDDPIRFWRSAVSCTPGYVLSCNTEGPLNCRRLLLLTSQS